jgi:hypothetical protein
VSTAKDGAAKTISTITIDVFGKLIIQLKINKIGFTSNNQLWFWKSPSREIRHV